MTKRIALAGIGGAGCRIARSIALRNACDYLLIDTDAAACGHLAGKRCLQVCAVADGVSTLCRSGVNRLVQFAADTELVVVIAGFGGIGAALAPAVAQAVRGSGKRVAGVIVTPFTFEEPRYSGSKRGLSNISDAFDQIVVVSNAVIAARSPPTTTIEAFHNVVENWIADVLMDWAIGA